MFLNVIKSNQSKKLMKKLVKNLLCGTVLTTVSVNAQDDSSNNLSR